VAKKLWGTCGRTYSFASVDWSGAALWNLIEEYLPDLVSVWSQSCSRFKTTERHFEVYA